MYKLTHYILKITIILLAWHTSLILALTAQQAHQYFKTNRNHKLYFLDIKGYQQTTDYSCGPALAMSLLKYYGMIPKEQMNARTELKIAKQMGTTVAQGTNEQQLANWFSAHGFKVKLGYNGSLPLIEHYLSRGIPVIVDWIDWGGHWEIVTGFDKALLPNLHETIYFADSAAHFDDIKTVDGITFFEAERFDAMWLNSVGKRRIYLIVEPKERGRRYSE